MRPHSITLRQFGPYVDHTVDLSAFHDAGMFLIHGDTGAGKSTLLDAMTWALYGRGLGDRATDEMIRNVAAPAEEPTEVSLDFSLGDRRYRVTRALEPERTSRRGTVTRARTTASLVSLAGDPRFGPVSGAKEVTQEAGRLLQLPHEQFSRVIVLPQGEFRDLLLASAKQREQLLEHLFGTERYARVEEQLRALDQDARTAFERADASVKALLQGVGASDLADLDAKSEAARAHLAGGESAVAALRAEVEATVAARSAARERERRDEQRRSHRDALVALAATADAAARDRATLARDAAAARCRGRFAELQVAAAAATARTLQLTEARAGCARLALEIGDPALLGAREVALRDSMTRAAAMRALADDAARLADVEGEIGEGVAAEARAARSLSGREESVASAAVSLREMDEGAAALEAALAEEPSVRSRVENLAARQQRLAERRAREDALRGLERSLRSARSTEREAEEAWRSAVSTSEGVRQHRLREGAARLAASLVDGEPCAVCGSREHPAPATPPESSPGVTPDDARVDPLAAALERSRREVLTLEVRVEEAGAALRSGGEAEAADEEDLGAAVSAGREALASLRRRRLDLDALRRRRLALAEESARSASALGPERAELIALRARVATLQESAARGRARLSAAGVGPEGFGAALAALDREVAQEADSLRVARERMEDASRRLAGAEGAVPTLIAEVERAARAEADARSALDAALKEAGFSNESDLSGVELAPTERARLEQSLEARARSEEAHREALDALGPGEAGDTTSSASLDLVERQLRERLETLQREAAMAQAALSSMQQQRAALATAHAARAEAEARALRVRRVAEVANGKGPTKVRLSRYVLLDLFDRVVERASVSLETVSDGRFRLRRQERAQTGREFDLAVEDAYVGGVARPVASLSGGEVFLASLAMALGLGEVLQAWSGGIRVESLFVDEGFGALDEDTIERAVELLERIPRGARMVGVVSHVPELRKRIPARLEVVRGDRGTHTRCSLRHFGGR